MGFLDKLLGKRTAETDYKKELKRIENDSFREEYNIRRQKDAVTVGKARARIKSAQEKKNKIKGFKEGNTGLFASNLLGGSGGYDYRPPVYEISGGKGNPLFPNIDIWENTKKRKRR